MTELIILRALGDVCLYFAVVGAFPLFFSHDYFLLYPALLCAAGVGTGAWLDRSGKGLLRYAALVVPVLSLLLADEPMEYLILIPVLLYTGVLIHRGAYALEYYSFRDQFLNVGRILCVFGGIVFALGYFEGMFGTSWETYDISAVLLYGLIYGLTGVFLMRQLRLGPDSSSRDRLANHVQMAVVVVLILALALLGVALEEQTRDLIAWVLHTVMAAVGLIPVIIQEIIFWFLKEDGGAYLEAVTPETTEPPETVLPTYPTDVGVPQMPPEEGGFPWWFAVLVLGMLCCAIFFLMRNLRRGSGGAGSVGELEEVEAPSTGNREPRRSNRSKVRKVYRSYLKLVRRKGQKLEPDQTTADILENHPENTDTEAAARLRQVYLKARYDTENPVTDREVEQAKTALKQVTDYHKTK